MWCGLPEDLVRQHQHEVVLSDRGLGRLDRVDETLRVVLDHVLDARTLEVDAERVDDVLGAVADDDDDLADARVHGVLEAVLDERLPEHAEHALVRVLRLVAEPGAASGREDERLHADSPPLKSCRFASTHSSSSGTPCAGLIRGSQPSPRARAACRRRST